MIETSILFSEKIAESSRQFKARLLYEGAVVSGDIRSITINKGACGESFSTGSVYSSYIEVTLDGCEELLENKELQLQIGLLVDEETIEYVDIGYYTVIKPKTSVYSTTFTAVGRISSKLNKLFEIPSTLTLRNIAEAITAATGVLILFNGEVSDAVLGDSIAGMTCKEALFVIACTFGGFATEDNAGNIVISKYSTDSKISIDGDKMTTLPEVNDLDYDLYGIKVVVSEMSENEEGNTVEEVAFTEGVPRITVTNKFMTADLFSAFLSNTIGYTYRPGTIPIALGDPRLQPWDCLEVTDVKSNVYIVPCLNIVHTFDGGFTTTVMAPGESEAESGSNTVGPISQQLERLSSLLLTAQEAIVKRLKADDLEAEVAKLGYVSIDELEVVDAAIKDLEANAISTKNLSSEVAKLGYLKADNLESEMAEFGYIKSSEADITYAAIEDLKAAEAEIEEIQAKNVEIEKLVANKIDAKKVESTYATIEELEAAEADIQNLEASTVKTEELDAEVAEFGYLKTGNLDAEVADLGYAKVKSLEAEYAKLDQTNIDQAWVIDLLVTGKFLADDFNAATGSFSKWLTGVNIIGDSIKAGTISTDRLIIRNPDTNEGILYEINNGVVDQTDLSEEELKRLCLDGKILVAESVTADKINVTDLFAQDITSTGNFNMGGKGALVYDAETDSLSIRAKEITLSTGTTVEEEIQSVKSSALIETYDEYATGEDATTEPTEWYTDKPTAGEGIYIWQRRVNVYGNGDVVYGPAVCITGSKGGPGSDGKSAYEIWLEAGNTGTVDDYLESLKGVKGETGTSVESSIRYYLLQSEDLEAPAAPTEYPPSEGWTDTEPEFNEENIGNLYTVDCTVFSDGTWAYTDVSLSTSYEAAKAAYKRAEAVSQELIETSSKILQTSEEVTLGILAGYTRTSDLEAYKKLVENLLKVNEEGVSMEFEQMAAKLNELGGEITTQKQYIRFIEGSIYIGHSDSPYSSVYTNDTLEFRYNDQMVARFTNEVLEVRNISAENQVAWFQQWAIRKGAYIEGVGYNLNDMWTGG